MTPDLTRTLTEAEAAAEGLVLVPRAEHEFNREVVRLARAEHEAYAELGLGARPAVGRWEAWEAHRRAWLALHATLAARPEGEEPR